MEQLGYFLRNWDGQNFIEELKKMSKSKVCFILLLDILSGQNFWESIENKLDHIGKKIIKSKNLNCLNILGEYILIKEDSKKQIIKHLIYPICLIFITMFIYLLYKLILIEYKINLNVLDVFIFLVINIIIFILLVYKIIKLINRIFILKIFTFFVEKKIDFLTLCSLIEDFNKKIYLKIKSIDNCDELTLLFLNTKFIDTKTIKEKINIELLNIKKQIETYNKYYGYIFLLLTGIFLSFIFSCTLKNIYEEILCMTNCL